MVADENEKSCVHVQPITSTRATVTFRCGFVLFSGDFRRVKVVDATINWRRRPEPNPGPRICNPLHFYIIQLHTGIATPNDTPPENLSFDDAVLQTDKDAPSIFGT